MFINGGKTNLVYILIVVLLAIIVGGGILTWQWTRPFVETYQNPSPECGGDKDCQEGEICIKGACIVQVEDETTNWQTYRNEEFGFEVRYPQDLFMNEFFERQRSVTFIYLWFNTHRKLDLDLEELVDLVSVPNVEHVGIITIAVRETDRTSIEDYELNHMEYATLGPYEVVRIFGDTSPYLWPGYIILWDGKEYVLTRSSQELGDQILPTFRFIE